jgi:flavin reductase (DIM6/NTAB) family NADH-FMN oxidoreductase RutF
MFYRTDESHGLRHNPFNALVVPRPIGWISTLDDQGRANLAPYSFFNAVAYHPPQVIFSSSSARDGGGEKDSVHNVRATGEFVFNLATWGLREAVNLTSAPAPHGTDEFEVAGLEKAASQMVAPPRVAASPVHFECRLVQVVNLLRDETSGDLNHLVVGHVVGIHIDESVIVDGRVDIHRLQPIARLGGADYARIGEVFSMKRPSWPI